MKNENSTRYFEVLSNVLLNTEVTDHGRKKLLLEEGMKQAIESISSLKKINGKVMLVGNGGSAAIASHQAVDFWKCVGIKATAFNDLSQLTCLSNDYGYEYVFSKSIEMFADEGDVLLAISSSGRSVNILKAVEAARQKNCSSVLTFSGFDADNSLRILGDLNFYVKSHSYGHVEISHLALIHAIADAFLLK